MKAWSFATAGLKGGSVCSDRLRLTSLNGPQLGARLGLEKRLVPPPLQSKRKIKTGENYFPHCKDEKEEKKEFHI